MIAEVGLALAAWAVVGVTGAPVDPFLPLIAALALREDAGPAARVATVTALGPLCALACGDLVAERTALYAAMGVLATRAEWTLRDGVAARTVLAGATLLLVLGVRSLLAAGGGAPPPAQGAVAFLGTVVWTAVHAVITVHATAWWPARERPA